MSVAKKSEQLFLEELMERGKEVLGDRKKIEELAKKTDLPLWQAQSISSFYERESANAKVCVGLPCAMHSAGNDELLKDFLKDGHEKVSCLGYCDHAPVVMKDGKYYEFKGKPVPIPESAHDGAGETDLQEYSVKDGFLVLRKMLDRENRKAVLDLLQNSGLKGMGGAGFPTYIKWKAVTDSDDSQKYLVINAHEGEPATFKDRIIMETRPFDLLQAAIVTAAVIESEHVIIALKWEYLNAERILKKALDDLHSYLKVEIPEHPLPEIRIMRVPGYYVTGEETALLEAIEGRRSEPRLRPPFPAEAGLFGYPTLIDNVETVVYLLELLGHHFKNDSITAGKKAYCLTGDVSTPGAYFVDYGLKASDLLQKFGGVSSDTLKAFLPGGLSGGILPSSIADTTLDFESVRAAGAGLGTGSMIAVSKNRCMVQILDTVEEFFARESCGKCMPCRIGTQQLSAVLKDLQSGKADLDDLKTAEEDARTMISGSICGLGQAAGRMFLDGLKHFRSEMEDHVNGKCPAGTCFKKVS